MTTCGRCHAGANLSFVQYQPHANAHDRKLNPALYFVRLFMNLLLASVLTFFMIHTILWLIRARYNQVKSKAGKWRKECLSLEQATKSEQAASAEHGARAGYFVRFTREQRYMHAVLFTTFLGLAATGLPMRFSESFWARKFADRRGRIRRDSLLP